MYHCTFSDFPVSVYQVPPDIIPGFFHHLELSFKFVDLPLHGLLGLLKVLQLCIQFLDLSLVCITTKLFKDKKEDGFKWKILSYPILFLRLFPIPNAFLIFTKIIWSEIMQVFTSGSTFLLCGILTYN